MTKTTKLKLATRSPSVETRPISARKRFKLDRIIEKPKLREDSLAVAKPEDDGKDKPVKAADKEEK